MLGDVWRRVPPLADVRVGDPIDDARTNGLDVGPVPPSSGWVARALCTAWTHDATITLHPDMDRVIDRLVELLGGA